MFDIIIYICILDLSSLIVHTKYSFRNDFQFTTTVILSIQAVGMFIGEFSCLVAFQVLWFARKFKGISTENMGNQDFSPFLLFIPAMCDMTGTSLM